MFVKDLKCIFSDKRTLILLGVLFVTAIIGIIFSVSSETEPAIKLGIVDEDDSEYSRLLVTYFDENKDFSSYISVVRKDRKDMEESFDKGQIDAYVVIPKDFADNLKKIQNETITAVINSSDTSKTVLLTNLLNAYSAYISGVEINCQALVDVMWEEGYESSYRSDVNYSTSIDLVFTALDKSSYFKRIGIDRFNGISLINYYLYSAIVMIILYGGMFAGMNALKERLGKAGERLKSLGASGVGIFLSKTAAYSIFLTLCVVILTFILNVFGRIEIPLLTFLVLIPIIIGSVMMFIVISHLTNSVKSYTIVTNMLILLMTIAGGGIIPIMYLPEACIKIAKLTPTYWFIRLICSSL